MSDDKILDFLTKEGLRPGDAENLTAALARVRRLSRYYYDEVEWDHVREHETRTFLVVPLLLALRWAEQQLKIEHPAPGGEQRGRVDICAFRLLVTIGHCYNVANARTVSVLIRFASDAPSSPEGGGR